MTKTRGQYDVVLAFLLMTGCVFCSCHRQPKEVILADYLLKHRLTTYEDSATISRVLDTLMFQAKWQARKQINAPYRPGLINVFLLDGSLSFVRDDEQSGQLLNNCYYAGSNIIFVDVAFLRSFLEKHHVVRSEFEESVREEYKCLLFWSIGHELGHLAHQQAGRHFEGGSLDAYVQNSLLNNKDELYADSFFVRSINGKKELRSSVENLMISILNAEIKQKIGEVPSYGVGIIYDYTNPAVVKYARQKTHPEYVIRVARILELSSKMSGDSGLHRLVGGFIKQLKEVN